jgi:hypothetical protein
MLLYEDSTLGSVFVLLGEVRDARLYRQSHVSVGERVARRANYSDVS